MTSLQSLFLGTNKITKLQNMDALHNLTVLSIQVFSHRSSSARVTVNVYIEKLILCTSIFRVTGLLKLRVFRTLSTWESSIWVTMVLRSLRAWKTTWVIEIQQHISERTVHHTSFILSIVQTCNYKVFFPSQKKLTTLDIAANRVKKIENISHLTELQEFWVCIRS